MGKETQFIVENGLLKKVKGILAEMTIPEGITDIGDGAFFQCNKLMSITLPESLTSIGSKAFYSCRSLTTINLPEGLKNISGLAFYSCRNLTRLTVPDGVTNIGSYAFQDCRGLKSLTIPNSVTHIGKGVFSDCRRLKAVVLPDGISRIKDKMFAGCRELTSLTVPDSITSIADHAFDDCEGLADADGSVIVKWLYVHYYGSGEYVAIPDGITRIAPRAFSGRSDPKRITLPESLTSIGDHAFYGCHDLKSVSIPEGVTSIGDRAFDESNIQHILLSEAQFRMIRVSNLNTAMCIRDGDRVRYIAYCAFRDRINIDEFVKRGNWLGYDLNLINNGPIFQFRLSARLIGALGRLLDPVDLTEESRRYYAELLNRNTAKLFSIAEDLRFPRMIEDVFSLGVLNEKADKALRKLLKSSSLPELAALAKTPAVTKKTAPDKPAPVPQSPLQQEYAAKLQAIGGDDFIRKERLIGAAMPRVLLRDGSEAPDELFRFLLASYGMQIDEEYHFVPEADEAAALLRYDSLCNALDAVGGCLDGALYPGLRPLLCRFGNAKQIRALIAAWKDWGDWDRFKRRGRAAKKALPAAMVLSDTREAMAWLFRHGGLDSYAALRGISVGEVCDRFLFDFGFDASGKRVFDLGPKTIEASLSPELTLELFDTAKKKTVKQVPKRDVDPALHKQVSDELTDMRRNIKRALSIKNGLLFEEFLEATPAAAESWKARYLDNPFLRAVARQLVWAQGGQTFTLTRDGGAVDSGEQPYAITDEPVLLAHPMEMPAKDVTAWQKYFISHGLKQPFQQIWEPVYHEEDIHPDRYSDSRIDPRHLRDQQQLGINCVWYNSYYDNKKRVTIDGFLVKARDAAWRQGDDRAYITLTDVTPQKWNRRANAVIAFLDSLTIPDRVKRDDLSVMPQMELLTLAQITEMIALAQDSNASRVLLALLDYKEKAFPGFDPMDGFTLDW